MKAQSNFSKKPKGKSTNSNQSGEIRIIGGQWRGRKLKVQNKEGLRPTTDRLKETIFNWLMLDIRGATVLDCFAGAGSLGFEAISRGADSLISIEKDKKAAAQLKANCDVLNANNQINVFHGDFFAQVVRLTKPFDIIFIDPPFHKEMVETTIKLLLENELIKPGALIYLEQESIAKFELLTSCFSEQFELKKEKRAGQVLAQLFVKN